MKKILILHGWGGSDLPHWQAILAKELTLENIAVSFPNLPNRDTPKYNEWSKVISSIADDFKPQIVVCHSLGCIAWLQNPYETQKLFLVAPPNPNAAIEDLKTFFPLKNYDTKSQETYLITSDNDEYISNYDAEILAKNLHVKEHIVLKNAGHINTKSGFGKWDFLKEKILS